MYKKKQANSGFTGDFKNWNEALAQSSGWDSSKILKKVKQTSLQVKNGLAVYEQDGVVFDKQKYDFPVLAGFLRAVNNKSICLVDFGGSLGSHYHQMKSFFPKDIKIKWNIVEQKAYVDCGKKEFENDELKFYYSVKDCKMEGDKDLFFSSGVIQYLENPYKFIEEIVGFGFKNIVLDRVFFIANSPDRIVLQKADPSVFYDASFPAWILNEDKFINKFLSKYTLVSDFKSEDADNKIDGIRVYHKGFI
ncbi:MAG TPA: methyltransferase, TIGR04325 family, partial [Bacteroidia bacterium]|nr:methyltransferase, TIGR04325 family [Bacteroidia bacterium]